jgi:hypothetical protein
MDRESKSTRRTDNLNRASESWGRFHEDEPDEIIEDFGFADPQGELREYGIVSRIEYYTERGDDALEPFHDFRRGCEPCVLIDEAGTPFLGGGRYTVDPDRGIVDGKPKRDLEPEEPDEDDAFWQLGRLACLVVIPHESPEGELQDKDGNIIEPGEDDDLRVEFDDDDDAPRLLVSPTGALVWESFDMSEED